MSFTALCIALLTVLYLVFDFYFFLNKSFSTFSCISRSCSIISISPQVIPFPSCVSDYPCFQSKFCPVSQASFEHSLIIPFLMLLVFACTYNTSINANWILASLCFDYRYQTAEIQLTSPVSCLFTPFHSTLCHTLLLIPWLLTSSSTCAEQCPSWHMNLLGTTIGFNQLSCQIADVTLRKNNHNPFKLSSHPKYPQHHPSGSASPIKHPLT